MSKKCARCDKTVYPIEELKCLDKIWHKTCFKCYECGMTLNMKTYKGFNKLPYCNAHCPVARATTVVETPESRRLAENTKIQSQVRYHEDFEKQKGKLTQVADDPETLRIRNQTKIISNATYHGEYEKKKQMEERRNMLENENNNVPVYKTNTEKLTKNVQSYSTTVDYPSNNNVAQPVTRNVNPTIDYQPRNQQYPSYGNNGNPVEQTRPDYYKNLSNIAQNAKISQTAVLTDNYMNDPRYVHSQMTAQQYYKQPQQHQQAPPVQYQQQQPPLYHDTRYSGGVPVQAVPNTKTYPVPNLGKCYRAIYDYTAQDVDEVSFQDGDLIIHCQAIDDGWMTGTVQRTMQTGMLPSNYVETA